MSEPIKVGDLVRIVKNHGCTLDRPHRGIGFITTVERIERAFAYHCKGCDEVVRELNGHMLMYGRTSIGPGYYPLAWVKRIPPLSELEGEKQKEDLREPA